MLTIAKPQMRHIDHGNRRPVRGDELPFQITKLDRHGRDDTSTRICNQVAKGNFNAGAAS
jgi:hypothetical protein